MRAARTTVKRRILTTVDAERQRIRDMILFELVINRHVSRYMSMNFVIYYIGKVNPSGRDRTCPFKERLCDLN